MKSKLNPLAIGMFVLTAAAIAIIAIMVFGAAKFFSDSEMCVSYFSESVHGLDVGAPVKYKGVAIGKVENISIMTGKNIKEESTVAIVYSIDLDLLKRKTKGQVPMFDNWLEDQISEGMRAKLNYQSIVTGMIYVELDYFAQENEKWSEKDPESQYIEIPSAKSGLAEIGKALEKTIMQISSIDFKNIGDHLDATLQTTSQKLEDIDAKGVSDSLKLTLNTINKTVSDVKLNETLENLNSLVKTTEGEVKTLSKAAHSTIASAHEVLANFNTIISPKSPFRYEFSLLMKNLNDASVSISNFTDYLQRNPSALVSGKRNPNN